MKVTHEAILAVNKVLSGRAFIAGGAVRSSFEGVDPRDIDIFMLTDDITKCDGVCRDLFTEFSTMEKTVFLGGLELVTFEEHRDTLMFQEGNYYSFDFPYLDTEITISVVTPQELYGRNTFGTMEHVVSEIDLNVCRWGVNDDNTIYSPEGEEQDNLQGILTKTMRLIKVRSEEEATRTATRVAKYEGYGYRLVTDTPTLQAPEIKIEHNTKLTKLMTNREKAKMRRAVRKGKKQC